MDTSTGVQADLLITVTGFSSHRAYPEQLRRIRYHDADTKQRLVFLTNQFSLPAIVIAQRSTCRWQVELFSKWITQSLQINACSGTTENTVNPQIWIAITVYVLVAIVKNRLNLPRSPIPLRAAADFERDAIRSYAHFYRSFRIRRTKSQRSIIASN